MAGKLGVGLIVESRWVAALLMGSQSLQGGINSSKKCLDSTFRGHRFHNAMWAMVLHAACNKTLLWVVANVGSQDVLYLSHPSICTHDFNTILAGFN